MPPRPPCPAAPPCPAGAPAAAGPPWPAPRASPGSCPGLEAGHGQQAEQRRHRGEAVTHWMSPFRLFPGPSARSAIVVAGFTTLPRAAGPRWRRASHSSRRCSSRRPSPGFCLGTRRDLRGRVAVDPRGSVGPALLAGAVRGRSDSTWLGRGDAAPRSVVAVATVRVVRIFMRVSLGIGSDANRGRQAIAAKRRRTVRMPSSADTAMAARQQGETCPAFL